MGSAHTQLQVFLIFLDTPNCSFPACSRKLRAAPPLDCDRWKVPWPVWRSRPVAAKKKRGFNSLTLPRLNAQKISNSFRLQLHYFLFGNCYALHSLRNFWWISSWIFRAAPDQSQLGTSNCCRFIMMWAFLRAQCCGRQDSPGLQLDGTITRVWGMVPASGLTSWMFIVWLYWISQFVAQAQHSLFVGWRCWSRIPIWKVIRPHFGGLTSHFASYKSRSCSLHKFYDRFEWVIFWFKSVSVSLFFFLSFFSFLFYSILFFLFLSLSLSLSLSQSINLIQSKLIIIWEYGLICTNLSISISIYPSIHKMVNTSTDQPIWGQHARRGRPGGGFHCGAAVVLAGGRTDSHRGCSHFSNQI